MKFAKPQFGFTLMEMLISVTIISLLAGVSIPVFASFQSRNDLAIAMHTSADSLRRAQLYSRTNKEGSQWGVNFVTGMIVIFKGSSYATRDASYDEVANVSPRISFSYIGEIMFEKINGTPSISGVQVLTSDNTGESRTLTMNKEGMVDY